MLNDLSPGRALRTTAKDVRPSSVSDVTKCDETRRRVVQKRMNRSTGCRPVWTKGTWYVYLRDGVEIIPRERALLTLTTVLEGNI